MSKWKPMDTAPRDGTRVLICTKQRNIFIGSCDGDDEFDHDRWHLMRDEYEPEKNITHWMPLPEPPKE